MGVDPATYAAACHQVVVCVLCVQTRANACIEHLISRVAGLRLALIDHVMLELE